MPDVYKTITEVNTSILEHLIGVLELRATDPQQQEMLKTYLRDADIPQNAKVLEIGCGTGPVSRVLATWPGVKEVIGVDPSPIFVAKARELGTELPGLTFQEADGQSLPFPDNAFDTVVFHTVLCHVPEPLEMLREGLRVLRPQGSLAVFDGDYATGTLATGSGDPLEALADAFREHFVHDPWFVRRLPTLVRSAGLRIHRMRSYGYVEALEPGFMLKGWVDGVADALVASGRIGNELGAGLKAEARRRVECGEYFGHIAYASLVAHKPV